MKSAFAAILVCLSLYWIGLIPEQKKYQIITQDQTILLELELANTNLTREVGLMWRRELSEYHGMLFVFPEENMQSFWMQNTYIPLDIIFIGSDFRILSIHSNAVPNSTRIISSDFLCKYVIELPAGSVEKLKIKVGDKVKAV